MALNFALRRIPLYFVIDAPQSVIGKWVGLAQGASSQVFLGLVKTVTSILPGQSDPYENIDLSFRNKIVIPMLVNPTSLSVQKNPTVVRTLTKRGILNQYFQAQPDTVSFEGRAASDRAVFIFNQLDSLLSTSETGTRNLITMIYKFGGVYRGYIENFRTTLDANQPGVFDYSFDFQFADKRHFKIFYLALQTNTLNEAIQNPAKFAHDQVKLAGAELKSMSGISLKF